MKHQLELRHFAALVALADHGTVGKAALALGVAQSTLSETLLSLERTLGAPVTERHSGRTPRLTEVALRLLPHARSILQAVDRAHADALGMPARIHIGATESLSTQVLPFVLEAFHQAYPTMDVQVIAGLCGSLQNRLARGELDLILTMEPASAHDAGVHVQGSGIETRVLRQIPLVLLGGPGAPAQLSGIARPVFHLPDPSGALHDLVRDWASSWCPDARLLSAGTVDAVRHRLIAGDGMSVLPRYAVTEHLGNETLRGLEPPVTLPALVAFASTRANSPLAAPVQALCTLVAKRLDELIETSSPSA